MRRDQTDAEARETIRDLRARLMLDLPSEDRVLAAAAIKADLLLLPGSTWRWEDLRALPRT